MSCGGFGSSSAADERTAPLLEPVVGPRTSSGRGVATILSLAESRSLERARAAFRKANEAALEGAEKLSEFSSWRRVSFQSRGSLKPRSSMDVEGPGLSGLQVAVTVWSSLMSTGIVALPYALSAAGWAGLLLICAAAAVTAYTGKLLASSLHTVNSRKRRSPERHMGEGFACTYDQLAKEVLGPSGGMLMQVLTLLECLGSAVCLIVLQAANWPSLIELQLPGWLSPSLVVALASGACSYALLLLDGRALARLGAGCHLLFAALLCVQFGLLLLIPPPPGAGCEIYEAANSRAPQLSTHLGHLAEASQGQGGRGGMGVAVGVVLFCFTGHASLPELYHHMRPAERPHFDRAVSVGHAASAACFCAFAAAGYGMFGTCCATAFTVTLVAASPLLGRLVTVALLADTLLMVPEWLGPVVRISLGWFGREVSHVGESVQGQRLLTAVRLALVVTAALVAAALPSYGDAVGLMGGFVTVLTAVLLPTLFYLAVHVGASEAGEPPTSAGQLVACALVVLGGLLAMTSALGALLGPLGMLIFLLLACILAGLLHSLWQAVNALQIAFKEEKQTQLQTQLGAPPPSASPEAIDSDEEAPPPSRRSGGAPRPSARGPGAARPKPRLHRPSSLIRPAPPPDGPERPAWSAPPSGRCSRHAHAMAERSDSLDLGEQDDAELQAAVERARWSAGGRGPPPPLSHASSI